MKAAAQEEGGTEEGREDGEMRSRAVEEVEVEREEGKEEGREEVVTCMLCIGRACAGTWKPFRSQRRWATGEHKAAWAKEPKETLRAHARWWRMTSRRRCSEEKGGGDGAIFSGGKTGESAEEKRGVGEGRPSSRRGPGSSSLLQGDGRGRWTWFGGG